MAVLEDFRNEIADYPRTKVTLAIKRENLISGTPGEVNINEVWGMSITINNNGELDMTDVSLHIQGEAGTLVSVGAGGPFVTSVAVPVLLPMGPPAPWPPMPIGAGTSYTVVYGAGFKQLCFKAPSTQKPAGTVLVTAHIGEWNASLQHILNVHSGHFMPITGGNLAAQVFP